MKRATILSALLVAAAPVLATAAQENFQWTGKVAAGQAIEIKGVNGGITATGSAGGDIEVTAVKKGRKSDPAEVKVEVVEHAGGVTICAVYPTPAGNAPNECKPGKAGRMSTKDNDVSVEFRVKVPSGVRFAGRTVNGGIAASGIGADVDAETVNGGVDVDAAGTVRAKTVNGGIDARLGRADWDGTLKMETVNGGIELALPAELSADVKAATVNGDIETDFPLTVTGKVGRRRLEGTIGSGGRLLEMSTVNGGISVHKAGPAKKAGQQ
jgi:DUF4097 and DUF4098 domain-containing protein YvlB